MSERVEAYRSGYGRDAILLESAEFVEGVLIGSSFEFLSDDNFDFVIVGRPSFDYYTYTRDNDNQNEDNENLSRAYYETR